MSQLLPTLLLILRLICPVCAVEPYEVFCTSQQDFKADTVAGYNCYGTNAKACRDAGGTFFDDRICVDIDTSTPDKCGEINGFTYEPVTCGGLGAYLSIPDNDNAARDLDCSGGHALFIIPQYQSTCCGGAGNHKRICNTPLILRILYSVMAIIYLALGIYGFRLLKADWVLGRKSEKESVLRMVIITTTIACIFLIGGCIATVITFSVIIKDVERDSERVTIGSLILLIIGGCLIFFAIIRISILSIQAMALAEAGIVATRKRWLILVGKYGALTIFLSFCAIGVLSLMRSNYDNFFRSMFVTFSVTFVFFGFLFGCMSYKFRTLAANQTSTNTEQQGIPNRCREIHRFTMIISICFFLIAIALALVVVMVTEEKDAVAYYLAWVLLMLLALVVYIIVRDLSLLTNRNDYNHTHEAALITPLLETTMSPKNCNDHTATPKVIPDIRTVLEPPTSSKPPTSALEVTGIAITNKDQHSIGMAPHAPRPSWLPKTGTGQANVEPNCWSISLENWVRFVHECMATATWNSLAETKGERNINMYDINVHFIKPWTSGTGCSIACLMNDNQGPVDLMVSHAWAGSVIESLNSIKTITTMYLIPKETRIFFDTVCLYQAEDDNKDGLSIPEQLKLKPFQTIIHNKPQRGMFIIHTKISEVYERLWCVHEVDEAIEAKIEIYGAFDPASWNAKALKSIVTSFSTEAAECQGESDKIMLTDLVNNRGGFDRLDSIVRDVRQQSITDLKAVNLFEQLFSMSISSVDPFHEFEV